MIRHFKALTVSLLSLASLSAVAQSTATTSSPYSRYGLGSLSPLVLPQNIAMGGIGVGTNNINGYNTVNPLNPASYSAIRLTVIDAGLYANLTTLSKTGSADQKNSNFRLNHVVLGVPVTKTSALSFGLMPYSELGYRYTQTLPRGYGSGSPADTNRIDNIYSGQGGLSKAHIGYGLKMFKHLAIGANVSYIFGDLKQYSSTELPELFGAFNTRQENSKSIGGVNYGYGLQYTIDLADDRRLILGYSGSAATKLNNNSSYVVSHYVKDYTNDAENSALDTTVNNQMMNGKIQLPSINRFGLSYQADGKFLLGADYHMANWSKFTVDGVSQGLNNTTGFNVGGQITPNSNSIRNYWALVDYRFGFHSEKTYATVNGQTINQYGATLGFGLPIPRNGSAYYKVNIAADLGRRGTLANALVRETYLNLHLSFTLNDRWFTKYKFD
ncbi:hypothetical protein [Mucilaginibacter myungsuensis]|uniref:Long-subunit fatty acid transport protein n=1 Tax=Mucilaginibacter myungsuensis TaxID=649104 RepID=A0A929KWX7_9SPHI|nr:hypothetical protein [Mucilaginibacter myungsuensis]MBE9661448.1 hypothetical protein [Mucilaginibacter myungsuensis]MDN3597591.1 hypothetical protein [Mucilaginibacter myungsuensis]